MSTKQAIANINVQQDDLVSEEALAKQMDEYVSAVRTERAERDAVAARYLSADAVRNSLRTNAAGTIAILEKRRDETLDRLRVERDTWLATQRANMDAATSAKEEALAIAKINSELAARLADEIRDETNRTAELIEAETAKFAGMIASQRKVIADCDAIETSSLMKQP